MDLIVSRVNGSFGGLGGATVIELEDGTAWKQANADDRFRGSPVDHPGAAVIRGVFGYKMRIEGVPEFYVDPGQARDSRGIGKIQFEPRPATGGYNFKLRSRPVQVEPDRMLHALIAQLDRPRLH